MRSLRYLPVRMLAWTAGRTRRACSTVVVAVLALAGLAAADSVPAGAATAARVRAAATTIPKDEGTASQDLLRTGWDPNEPTLTPAVVNGPTFGQVFSTSVSGQIYGQPLIIGNTLIAVTENDWVYGLNATTGAVLWKTSLGTPYHITTCQDLVPNIGDTSTPVYDPSTGTVYVMALVKEISYQFHLFGLNVATGAITLKKRIAGSPANDPGLSFNAIVQNQRPGLLLLNGWVYAGFASYCDHGSYRGYVAGVHVAQRPITTTLWTDEAGVSHEKAGIWQSGGGLMSDGPGRIFFTSGNGISPAKAPGNQPPGQLAESVVRLAVNSDGSLTAKDFFSPANAPSLDAGDHDFGAGGPVGLPFGTSTYPHILTQQGKVDGVFLLNRDSLGGREQASGNGDLVLANAGPFAGQWGHPGIFADTTTLTSGNAASSSDYMVFVGKDDYMRELKFGVNGSDKPTLTDYANSTFTLGFGSGSPVITSNGTDASSAIIWAVNSTGSTGTNSMLGAWDLLRQPRAGGGTKLREIWSAVVGTAAKFTIAATSNGMVYVGTRDGKVLAFGIKSGTALQRSSTVTYPDTSVGSAASTPVTVTATKRVTVTGVSVTSVNTPDPYTVSKVTETHHGSGKQVPVKFPVTLHKADALHAQVKFAPAAPGGATGQVTFATAGAAGSVAVPLIGEGTQAGLFATVPAMSFVLTEHDGAVITNVPVGIIDPLVTTIVNGGDTPVTVTSVKPPADPYTALNLPKVGTVIRPGESIPVQVTYAPQQAVTSNSSFTITASTGTSTTVTLTGTGLPPVTKFTASPSAVNFGSVRVGHTATMLVHVVNAGNQPSLMQRTPLPGGPFGAPLRVTSGLPVNGGYDLELPVTFHPTKTGAFRGAYKLRWTDRFGAHTLNVPISGTGVG